MDHRRRIFRVGRPSVRALPESDRDRSRRWHFFSGLGPTRLTTYLVLVVSAATLAALPAQAQLALPHSAPATSIETGVDAVFTIDLGTVSLRPTLEIEAIPDAGHADMELEIELTNFVGFVGPPPDFLCDDGGPFDPLGPVPLNPAASFVSVPTTGTQTLAFDLPPCHPDITRFVGTTVDVRVRAVTFGSWGSPADVDITILTRTSPPFNEIFAAATDDPRDQVIQTGIKDTTIYQDNPSASNGRGEFLWAGHEVNPGPVRDERRALIAVDVTSQIPAGAEINEVELILEATDVLGGGGLVELYEVAINPINPWVEGNVDALGDEFDGALQSPAANWTFRRAINVPWSTPGGDFFTPALASATVVAPGAVSLKSPALATVVSDMIAINEDEDGFLLAGPGAAASQTTAVQFGSSDSLSSPPQMVVTYTPANAYSQGEFLAGTLSFVDEGENLRWIYDLDADDVLETQINGICEVDDSVDLDLQLPYSYDYQGTPGYVGYDCCMWQIDSQYNTLVGTGQAIFFHNIDPSDPANFPPDTDGDGIRDVCDNCIYHANGPLLGSCEGGATPGVTCINDGQCGAGGLCDQSQADDDLNTIGNACPEPGFAMLVGCGILGLSTLGSRRATHGDRRDHASRSSNEIGG